MNLQIIPLPFLCEFIDSSLGMGYGTILSPILLLMGFVALGIVIIVLGCLALTRLSRNCEWEY